MMEHPPSGLTVGNGLARMDLSGHDIDSCGVSESICRSHPVKVAVPTIFFLS